MCSKFLTIVLYFSFFLLSLGSDHKNKTFNFDEECFIDYYETQGKIYISEDDIAEFFSPSIENNTISAFRKRRTQLIKGIKDFAKQKNLKFDSKEINSRKNQKGRLTSKTYVELNLLLKFMEKKLPSITYAAFTSILKRININRETPPPPNVNRPVDNMTPEAKAKQCATIIKRSFCSIFFFFFNIDYYIFFFF